MRMNTFSYRRLTSTMNQHQLLIILDVAQFVMQGLEHLSCCKWIVNGARSHALTFADISQELGLWLPLTRQLSAATHNTFCLINFLRSWIISCRHCPAVFFFRVFQVRLLSLNISKLHLAVCMECHSQSWSTKLIVLVSIV